MSKTPRKPTKPQRVPTVSKAQIIQFPCPPGTAKRLARCSADVAPPGKPLPQPTCRWFLGQDNDGHSYLVPTDRRDDFETWISWPEGDERGWNTPDYVWRIEGERLEFAEPTVGGQRLEDLMASRRPGGAA